MPNVTFTRINARENTRRVVNTTTAPMRAVLKQVMERTSERQDIPGDKAVVGFNVDPGLKVEFPYGPADVKYANIALRYSKIARPGLQPLLVRTSPQLNVVTFTATIADKQSGGKSTVEDTLDILKQMAAEDRDCEFIYGLSALPYRVRITQMDINSRYRNLEGQLTQANVSIQLTEAPEFDPLLGELTAVTPVGAPTPIGQAVPPNENDYPSDRPPTDIDNIIVRNKGLSG
jgi:hypothetical protein